MKYHCDNCDSKFDVVVPEFETVVKGEFVRAKNNMEKPCCEKCLKEAFDALVKVVSSL